MATGVAHAVTSPGNGIPDDLQKRSWRASRSTTKKITTSHAVGFKINKIFIFLLTYLHLFPDSELPKEQVAAAAPPPPPIPVVAPFIVDVVDVDEEMELQLGDPAEGGAEIGDDIGWQQQQIDQVPSPLQAQVNAPLVDLADDDVAGDDIGQQQQIDQVPSPLQAQVNAPRVDPADDDAAVDDRAEFMHGSFVILKSKIKISLTA
jgi:hypothetical protein